MIQAQNLSKRYGETVVFENATFVVPRGSIGAIVGCNGSGKTTIMKILSGAITSFSGSVAITGKIGTLLGADIALYSNLTGLESIRFFGRLKGVKSDTIAGRIKELDSELDMPFLDMRISEMSRGMRQKVAFATALIDNPDVLLLDEPSTGLDLISASNVIRLLKLLKSQEKTVLLSTHNIHEIADLSDLIIFIKNKRLLLESNPASLFQGSTPDEKSELIASMISK